jgi:hypothetical protein
MTVDAEKFWADFESESGEKVAARSIGELIEEEGKPGRWGLLILTDKAFRFKHMPSENWILSLFKRGDMAADKREPVDLRIPREDILELLRPRRGFLGRLLGPAFPQFSLRYRVEGGEETRFFTVDPGTGLLAALEKAASGAEAS